MNLTRKNSPRTFKMESTGPNVPSRYLTGPTGSCHDHCKPKQTTETKPINPLPKRVPKPPADNSVPRTNKSLSVTPKTTTSNFKNNNNNVVKDQTLKKDAAIEPKKRDFKLKSVNSQAKTNNMPSSRTPRRRQSDNFVPNKDMSLQSSRLPKRRLSEVIIHRNTNTASVSNGSMARGSGINKNESRKDSKLPLANKKSISVKTTVSTSKRNVKVSPSRTYKSPKKPELNGSRKSKPVKPIVPIEEETLHVNESNNDVEITKSQNQKSPDCSPLSSEVKATKDDQDEVVESLPPTMESLPHSMGDDTIAKDDQNEEVEASPPPMEDDTLGKDDQTSLPPMEDDTLLKDDQNGEVESLPPLEDTLAKDEVEAINDDQKPSIEDDTLEKDGQQNEQVSDSEHGDTNETTHVIKLLVETNDSSLDDLTFRRGTILSPESENNRLIELQFTKGKELEKESEEGVHVTLKRLSSDGVVCVPESVPITVDLKHQEMEEKKAAVVINNVIEEAASKLIQTRKSKVKALVGAFETIVSAESETPKSYRSSRST